MLVLFLLLYLSDGTYIQNPKFYIHEEKSLAEVQRKFSKTEKGTYEKTKFIESLCRIYERAANKRGDFAQKLSENLVDNYGIICFEDLYVKNITKNHNLTKHILDAAWSKLITYKTYKAENAGRCGIFVDPKNTSKMCSNCGMLVDK
jgi:putative transposase